MAPLERIRNIGIIAHVDHGKTTLVDCLLRQSGTLLDAQSDRVMDSNALERERGITILSKVTSIIHKGYKINIVDTPGHADFGGEVERILSMVDGVALLVDGSEGVMTQTKFVLNKALQQNLRPLVVFNKVDRPSARIDEVDNEIMDLFMNLGASEEQLDYPMIFASGKQGWATESRVTSEAIVEAESNPDPSVTGPKADMIPLLDLIIKHVRAPSAERSEPFSMLVTQIDYNPYLGKCYVGRITSGVVKIGDRLKALDPESGAVIDDNKVSKMFLRVGVEQVAIEEAGAGEIITLAGVQNAGVNSTLCHPSVTEPLPFIPVDPPTISMAFGVNDSPLGGQEGTRLTSNMIRDRLMQEAATNVALRIKEAASKESFEVCGRGELQLGILIESMRREGFELSISPPKVIFKTDPDSKALLEPVEEVTIDVDPQYSGTVIEKMSQRKGELKHFTEFGDKSRLIFECPTRGLLGYTSEFKNDTHGTGVLNHVFAGYIPHKGPLNRERKPVLVSMATGQIQAYSLNTIEPRGKLFVLPGEKTYTGMIIGEYNREEADLEVNPTRSKHVTNHRAAGKEEAIRLTPIKQMGLEEVIAYVNQDEVIEVTPKTIRLRKRILDPTKRKHSRNQS
ncbi:GTP-binding protein TypA [Dimargaris cristalligena]|uniref:GTP-binding protein TypA n=1 Tax=Dimargaris cristalligena TaxID=215637 RepID=A0A4P9ZNS7_9FUNG|nr:GTP-binding protein TypA [Dimargaris cristalligena]|eukprot:RKP34953.1 GTP-binding protein TypA [Dimargaris cristalligena]